MHSESQKQEEQGKRRKRGGLFFWLSRLLVTMILLTFLGVAVIHLPPVQRWGISKVTALIGGKLNTKVSLSGFTLHPVSDLSLHDIFIGSPDRPWDTLLYAGRLSVDYRRIWDILKRRVNITSLEVIDARLIMRQLPGDSLSNLDLALARLLPPKDESKPDFVLDLNRLAGRNLEVVVDDQNKGNKLRMHFRRADLDLERLDIAGKHIMVSDIDLDGFDFSIAQTLPAEDSSRVTASVTTKSWSFNVGTLRLTDGKFKTANLARPVTFYPDPWGIDYAHLDLEDVDMEADSLVIRGWDFKGKNIRMHIQHRNGFEIKTFAAQQAYVTDTAVHLAGFRLITPDTRIENSISLFFSGFTDFQSFPDSVRLDIPEADISLRVRDLLAVAPGLQQVDFFASNAGKDLVLQGRISGYVNRLRIQDMNMELGSLNISGDFRGRDLTIAGSQLLSLDLKRSSFSAAAVKQLFPKWKLPPMVDRLGQIRFTGKFDGYPDDFVAYGTFHTSLGAVNMDMNLNTAQGLAEGKYSGNIGMTGFELGKFMGIRDLGKVSFNGMINQGKGLSGKSLSADIAGRVQAITYRDYTWQDIRIDGKFDDSVFRGLLDINDPNAGVHFDGVVDFRDSFPALDCRIYIDTIRFDKIGLMEKPFALSGVFDVDLIAAPVQQMTGSVQVRDLALLADGSSYCLDSLYVSAAFDSTGHARLYHIDSEVITGTVGGTFDPVAFPGQLHSYLHRHYPDAIDAPSAPSVAADDDGQYAEWKLLIRNSDNWFTLLGIPSLWIKNVHTRGSIDLGKQRSGGTIELPELHFGSINAYATTIHFEEQAGRTTADLELIAADLNEGLFFEDVLIAGVATSDSVRLNFQTDHLANIIDELDLDVEADPENGVWNIALNPKRLLMLGDNWVVPDGNKIEIRKNEFNLENFALISGAQQIIVDDIDRKGIEAHIEGFDISYLNELWINDKFAFSGIYTLDFTVDNLYDIRQMRTDLAIPAMRINNVPYGEWTLHAAMREPKDSVRIKLDMAHNETTLLAEGAYLPPIRSIPKEAQNYLRMSVTAVDFPLDFLEFLLGGNIRDTEGSVDMALSLNGKLNQLVPEGTGKVYNGSTRIDYLGALYSFHNQQFRITDKMIDLSGVKLYDVQGNTASVEGGITHRYFRDLGLNATITSPRIMGLDVTSQQNNVFYGKGIGAVHARFTGSLANANMQIQVTTGKGTHIYIPLSGAGDRSEQDFVIFLQNGRLPLSTTTHIDLAGINMELNMTVTEDAIVEIIFDENTGEVLRGAGRGNLQLAMTRTGQFTMYGNYAIDRGDYMFTNWVIRKPFVLKEGGTIHWDGDPYNAIINIQAQYKGLTAPVYRLIEEFISDGADAGLINQARERTPVDLTMTLTGSLMHPNFAFDIAFPELTGTLKGYTDSKINSLKANNNAMLEQVAGLLLSRSFWPSSSVGVATLSRSIDNTLSEWISATLSSYLGGLLSNLIPQGTFFTGIDLNVGLDLPITSGQGTGVIDESGNIEDQSATSYEISLPLEFFNDRLSVNVGGNYVTGATLANVNDYWAGDVTFEYDITPDRRLKIRAYNRNTVTVEGRRNKIGVGLSYRREADSLAELLGRKKKKG